MTDALHQQIKQYQQALIEAQCAGDRQSEARILSRLGKAYTELGEIEQAQGYLQQALVLARQSSETQVMGQALANVGLLHTRRGETRKAILCYLEALDAADSVSEMQTQISILDALIEIYQGENEPDKVLICAEHKLTITEKASEQALEEQAVAKESQAALDLGHHQQTSVLEQGPGNIEESRPHNAKMIEPTKEPSILSRLIGGTVFTGFGRLSSILFSLVNVYLVTRALPAGDYGTFVILRVVVLFLGQISSFGLEAALPVFMSDAQDADQKRRTFNTVLYFRLLTIIIVSAIAIPLRAQIGTLFGRTIEQELLIAIPILFLLETMFALMQSALQSLLQFSRIGMSDFIAGLANLLLIIVFVLWLQMGFLGLMYARCLALVIALVFVFISLPIQKRLEFDGHILRKILKFGTPLQLNNILSFIFGRIDTVLIGLLLGAEGVAYYEIARKIPDTLNMGFEAYRMVYYPYVSRFYAKKQYDHLAKLLNNTNRLVAFVTLLGALITLLFSHELVLLLFTSEYEPSASPLIVLMIGLCFSMIGYVLGTSLVAIGDTTKPPLINIAHMLVNVAGNLLLIPRFGITGAALSALAGSVVTNPLNVYFLRRRNVAVNTLPYVKAIIIFVVHAVVYLILLPAALWIRGLFFIPFLLSSILFSVITQADIRLLFEEARSMVLQMLNVMQTRAGKL